MTASAGDRSSMASSAALPNQLPGHVRGTKRSTRRATPGTRRADGRKGRGRGREPDQGIRGGLAGAGRATIGQVLGLVEVHPGKAMPVPGWWAAHRYVGNAQQTQRCRVVAAWATRSKRSSGSVIGSRRSGVSTCVSSPQAAGEREAGTMRGRRMTVAMAATLAGVLTACGGTGHADPTLRRGSWAADDARVRPVGRGLGARNAPGDTSPLGPRSERASDLVYRSWHPQRDSNPCRHLESGVLTGSRTVCSCPDQAAKPDVGHGIRAVALS
jgi:hypothetical protein